MSFGGSTAAANHTVKANRALVRGRNHFFDRNVDLQTCRYVGEVPTPTTEVREKNRRKLAREKARERRVWAFCLTVGGALAVLWFMYGLPASW